VRFRFGLLIAIILAFSGYSCKQKGGKFIDQGEIHYNIDYIGDFGPMPREVMPKNLIVSFKTNKILFEITSPIGNSGIINLANPDKEIFDTYFSMFSVRYYYAAKPGEQHPGFEGMKGMEIRETSKTGVICGFNCKNAEVTFPSDRNKIFNIWYTNEINIKNPNAATPFRQINGVLMNFFFFMGTAELHFNAETVYKKDIPDITFERRQKYQKVSREQIDNLIGKMINL
jgi:hypothetical protein